MKLELTKDEHIWVAYWLDQLPLGTTGGEAKVRLGLIDMFGAMTDADGGEWELTDAEEKSLLKACSDVALSNAPAGRSRAMVKLGLRLGMELK